MTISGSTKIVGLMGWPVEHSLSPAMHNAAFKELGLDWVYVPFPVEPGNFRKAVLGLPKLGVAGVNITVPYKEKAFRLLERLGKVTRVSKDIGAVNTISIKGDSLLGSNTDYNGFRDALLYVHPKFSLSGKKAVIIGAGGTARTITHALAWSHIKHLCLINRTASKAEKLAADLRRLKSGTIAKVCTPDSDNALQEISEASLLINATSLGMHDGDPAPVDLSMLHDKLFVFDVIYNRETELLHYADKIGAKTMDGLEMLVYQGARAFDLWTKKNYTPANTEQVAEIMRKAAHFELKKRYAQ